MLTLLPVCYVDPIACVLCCPPGPAGGPEVGAGRDSGGEGRGGEGGTRPAAAAARNATPAQRQGWPGRRLRLHQGPHGGHCFPLLSSGLATPQLPCPVHSLGLSCHFCH